MHFGGVVGTTISRGGSAPPSPLVGGGGGLEEPRARSATDRCLQLAFEGNHPRQSTRRFEARMFLPESCTAIRKQPIQQTGALFKIHIHICTQI